MAKKYEYTVLVTRKTDHTGLFTVTSGTKLTEDEALEQAQELAFQGEDPDGGWEEVDVRYDEDSEIQDGEDNLKEEA